MNIKIDTFQGLAECRDEYEILDALERRYVFYPKPLKKFPEVRKSLLNLETLRNHKKLLEEIVIPAFKSPAFKEVWPRIWRIHREMELLEWMARGSPNMWE